MAKGQSDAPGGRPPRRQTTPPPALQRPYASAERFLSATALGVRSHNAHATWLAAWRDQDQPRASTWRSRRRSSVACFIGLSFEPACGPASFVEVLRTQGGRTTFDITFKVSICSPAVEPSDTSRQVA